MVHFPTKTKYRYSEDKSMEEVATFVVFLLKVMDSKYLQAHQERLVLHNYDAY